MLIVLPQAPGPLLEAEPVLRLKHGVTHGAKRQGADVGQVDAPVAGSLKALALELCQRVCVKACGQVAQGDWHLLGCRSRAQLQQQRLWAGQRIAGLLAVPHLCACQHQACFVPRQHLAEGQIAIAAGGVVVACRELSLRTENVLGQAQRGR